MEEGRKENQRKGSWTPEEDLRRLARDEWRRTEGSGGGCCKRSPGPTWAVALRMNGSMDGVF